MSVRSRLAKFVSQLWRQKGMVCVCNNINTSYSSIKFVRMFVCERFISLKNKLKIRYTTYMIVYSIQKYKNVYLYISNYSFYCSHDYDFYVLVLIFYLYYYSYYYCLHFLLPYYYSFYLSYRFLIPIV